MNNKSNEQLGRELAEKAGLEVRTDFGEVVKYRTDKSPFEPVENLCTSLDAIAEIEKIVIETVGFDMYDISLDRALDSLSDNEKVYAGLGIVADARTRAKACLLALTEKI